MGDTFITVVAIALAAVLMLVFPLMSLAERTDDISQLAATTATAEFTDKVRTTGRLTLEDYEKYIQTLTSTGNAFDVEMQIMQLDENPGVKVSQAEMTKIGENVYYNKYTSQVEEELNKNGRIRLKEGDMFYVTIKNTNETIAESLRNFFYQLTGNDSYQIGAKTGGVVTVNGSQN